MSATWRLATGQIVDDAVAGARLLSGLPAFLRRPIGLEEAEDCHRRWIHHRSADFLALARWAIYENPRSPYRWLLDTTGCEYGDLEALVLRDGLEAALHALFRRGVFLTVDELKGRAPIVRGSARLEIDPRLLRNPRLVTDIASRTGGSRGAGTEVPVSLATIRDRAMTQKLFLGARRAFDWSFAFWIMPGGGGIGNVLEYMVCGVRPSRLFWRVDLSDGGVDSRFRWSMRALQLGALFCGHRLPRPVFVSHEDTMPIVRWLAEELHSGNTPHLMTPPSGAVRVCESALAANIGLHGAELLLVSEPLTAARRSVITKSGASATPRYASAECRPVAYGCLAPKSPDDLHLVSTLSALIQAGNMGVGRPDGHPALPAKALLVTSLRSTAPLILLNVSLGDQASVDASRCGCPLEELGWTTHLREVRSYEKLTAGGMTFLDSDVIRVLEEVLPTRFGGGPADYQLVEEEIATGQVSVTLVIHPRVGPLDEQTVIDAFLSALGPGSGGQRVMAMLWQQANLTRLERRPPLQSAAGKILHLHQRRGAPPVADR